MFSIFGYFYFYIVENQKQEKHIIYFIAIVPPEDISTEITGFKEDFANRFESSRALKVVPHITLKAPFKLSAPDHQQTMQWFEQISVTISFFTQELKDFGAFENKRRPVIFVNPLINPSLATLQKEVLTDFRRTFPKEHISKQEFEFHPHITIAYRDLQLKYFKQAWHEYKTKKYSAAFEVKCFHLFQHDSRKWNSINTHYLK